jgi:heme exporter protein CcmD
MKDYAFYIMSAYFIAAAVMAGLAASSLWRWKKVKKA